MHVAPSHYTHMLWRSCWEHRVTELDSRVSDHRTCFLLLEAPQTFLGSYHHLMAQCVPMEMGLFRLRGVLWQLRCCSELLVRTCPGRAAHRSVPRQLWDLSPNRNTHVSLHPIVGRQDTPVEGGREGDTPNPCVRCQIPQLLPRHP